jgi:hypothetical protein
MRFAFLFLSAFALFGCSSSSSTEPGSVGEGGQCSSDAQCAAPSDGRTVRCQCVQGNKSQVCTAQIAIGAKCPAGGPDFSIGCSGASECINDKCQIRAALGESCADNVCQIGLSCQSGKCAEGHKLGESCDSVIDDCALPNYCAFGSSSKCTVPGKVGDACSGISSRECSPGLACDAFGTKKCVALADDGTPCKDSTLCKSGQCVFSAGSQTCGHMSTTNVTVVCGF